LNQTDFASLAAITQPMVSKYLAAGFVKLRADGKIDARASLEALAGRLDETKRAAALEKLAFLDAGAAAARETPANAPRTPSAKSELDEIKRDQARLDYAKAAGELIPASAVEEIAFDAAQAMRQAMEQTRRPTAERLCADLGLTPDRAQLVARALQRRDAAVMAAFVEKIGAPASDAPADPVQVAAE
jgi:hypothetical protein